MNDPLEQIRDRAHALWEAEGRPHGRDREHWLQAEQELGAAPRTAAQPNEGEGNRTATRRYNAKTKRFIETGQVEAKAREAADAVSGPEGEELRRAEAAGKRRSRGEDPAVRRGTR